MISSKMLVSCEKKTADYVNLLQFFFVQVAFIFLALIIFLRATSVFAIQICRKNKKFDNNQWQLRETLCGIVTYNAIRNHHTRACVPERNVRDCLVSCKNIVLRSENHPFLSRGSKRTDLRK